MRILYVKIFIIIVIVFFYQPSAQAAYGQKNSSVYIKGPSYNYFETLASYIQDNASSEDEETTSSSKISFEVYDRFYIAASRDIGIGSFTSDKQVKTLSIGYHKLISQGGSFYIGAITTEDQDHQNVKKESAGFEVGFRSKVDRDTEFSLGMSTQPLFAVRRNNAGALSSEKEKHIVGYVEGTLILNQNVSVVTRFEFLKTETTDEFRKSRVKFGFRYSL